MTDQQELSVDEVYARLRAAVDRGTRDLAATRGLAERFWPVLDLEEANGRPIDAVIATKFPSYVIRHPNKVVWLLHQFRQAWDLDRTELGQFSESAEDRALRRKVLELDRVTLGEAKKIFTTSSIVAGRLLDSTGLEAEVLAPPPAPLAFHTKPSEGFVLSVNSLYRANRSDLLIEAAAVAPEPPLGI